MFLLNYIKNIYENQNYYYYFKYPISEKFYIENNVTNFILQISNNIIYISKINSKYDHLKFI